MMVSSIPFTLCFSLWLVHGTFIKAFSFSKPTAYRSAHPKVSTHRSRHSIKQQSTSCKSSSTGSTSDTESSNTITPKSISSRTYSHHIAIKTRNIHNAIDFYSLLGFRVETKFISGPSKCAWLLHSSHDETDDHLNRIATRIELLEVPNYMLNEPEGMKRRAVDLTKREELLGLNHFALDVTHNIPRSVDASSPPGTACELYQLREWMDDLNQLSIEKFGKSLRIALPPTKRMIGREVYEMAFLYDADGALVELLNHSRTLRQEVEDGWEPWDGPWIARQED